MFNIEIVGMLESISEGFGEGLSKCIIWKWHSYT